MLEEDNIPFCKQLRSATRKIHKISDTIVNAKFAIASSNNKVWADGLIVFYEVFKFLEANVSLTILPIEYHRRKQFESDLDYYLGRNWKDGYEPRPSVKKYLSHLEHYRKDNPLLLNTYVYHLYMGLLSSGQILQKYRSGYQRLKCKSAKNVEPYETDEKGRAITSFTSTGYTINELTTRMQSIFDEMGHNLDSETRILLCEESRKVFELNNEIVQSIEGVNNIVCINLSVVLFVWICISICINRFWLFLENYIW